MAIVQSLTVLSHNFGCRGTPGGPNQGQAELMLENQERLFCLMVAMNWFVYNVPIEAGFQFRFFALDDGSRDFQEMFGIRPKIYVEKDGGLTDVTSDFTNAFGEWTSSKSYVSSTGRIYIVYEIETYPRLPLRLKIHHWIDS